MAIVTRFNPTVNGPLHLGHLYLALVNAHTAQSTDGRFIVRFDDNHPHSLNAIGWSQATEWRNQMIDDLSPFVTPDRWTSEADYALQLEQRAEMFREEMPNLTANERYGVTVHGQVTTYYPYAAALTAEKVYLDMLEGVTWLVRGIDLISEFCLYEYLRKRAGIPYVNHVYMPRLLAESGDQIAPVAKTQGNFQIAQMVKARGVDGVMDILRVACLVDREGPFSIANIKSQPRLTL
jgi:glutamyl/glutaminyl-tRNA synthetase